MSNAPVSVNVVDLLKDVKIPRKGKITLVLNLTNDTAQQVGIVVNDGHRHIDVPTDSSARFSIRPILGEDEDADAPKAENIDLHLKRDAEGNLSLNANINAYTVEFSQRHKDYEDQFLVVRTPMHNADGKHLVRIRGQGMVEFVMGDWQLQLEGSTLRIICAKGRLVRANRRGRDLSSRPPLAAVA